MRLLFTIVERHLMEQVEKIYLDETDSYCLELTGKGTAPSEIMDILGLGSPDKAIILGVVKKGEVTRIFEKLEEKLKIKTKSVGVSFSIPLAAISKNTVDFLNTRLDENK